MPVAAVSILPMLFALVIEIVFIVLCIRIGKRKGIHVALCVLAGFFHILGLIVILLIPAKGGKTKHSDGGFAPPVAQTYTAQNHGNGLGTIRPVDNPAPSKQYENHASEDKALR